MIIFKEDVKIPKTIDAIYHSEYKEYCNILLTMAGSNCLTIVNLN